MDNSKRGHIPMQERLDLNKSQGAQMPKEGLNSIEGMYLMSMDDRIPHAQNLELNALRCWFRGLIEMTLHVHSSTGYCLRFEWRRSGRGLESSKQREFIQGLVLFTNDNEPFKYLLPPIQLLVHYANEPGVQKGARHYQRRYHYVRECVELGEIRILKVHTDNNLRLIIYKCFIKLDALLKHAGHGGFVPAEDTQGTVDEWAFANSSIQYLLDKEDTFCNTIPTPSSKMDKVSEYSDSKPVETMVPSLPSCRGAGHVVALTKPEEALFMVSEWLGSHANLSSS
ncbi:hypothetical protein Tco_1217677 [Tanacetum coccineum]